MLALTTHSVGPTVGPLVGAWLGQTIGWRWSFWIVLIPGALNTIVIALFSCETSERIIIQNKIRRMSEQLGRADLRSCYEDLDAAPVPRRTILAHGLIRPLKMLCLFWASFRTGSRCWASGSRCRRT